MPDTNVIAGSDGDQFKVHTTQQLSLGQEMHFQDGRRFRYSKAGAVAVVVAKFYQGAIPVTGTSAVIAPAAAAAVGDRSVSMAIVTNAVAADEFRDGYLVVQLASNTGFGYIYQVGPHAAAAASTTLVVPLRSPVQVAIATTAASALLIANPNSGVILAVATTPTAVLAGVSQGPIPIGQYGWLLVSGITTCLAVGTVVIGTTVMIASTTGGVMPQTTAVSLTVPGVGICVRAATAADYCTISVSGIN